MSLTNPNTVVTEERLSEFYQGILPYLGGMPEAVCNKFSKSDLLSTTEKIVGCNTDGKPMYQKTFKGNLVAATTMGTEANTEIEIGASVDTYEGYTCFVINNGGYQPIYTKIPDGTNDNHLRISFNANSNASKPNRIMIRNTFYGAIPYICTIKYTKTTDAANSFNYADENDYSTTEKIVGTWIDGKPVYQKVIDIGYGPNNGNKDVSTGITNFKRIIKLTCISPKNTFDYAMLPSNTAIAGAMATGCWMTDTIGTTLGTTLRVQTNYDASSNYLYAILQYTKTTD